MDLSELARALAIFDQLDPARMQLHHVQVLVYVAQKGACSYRQIEEAFSLSNASVSRICGALSDASNRRKETMNLVVIERDAAEGRRHRVTLSPKGKALFRAITTTHDQWKQQEPSPAGPMAGP